MMFERRPKETEKAFETFSAYPNMGTKRSLVKVAKQLGEVARLIERSSKLDGTARVGAWAGSWQGRGCGRCSRSRGEEGA